MAKKILVVDDEADVVELIRKRLEIEGFEVSVAFEGMKAIELAHKIHPHLVILDVMIPAGDGYSVCQILKTDSQTKDIPVIFLSVKAGIEDEIKAYKAGGIYYLRKPYEGERLVEIVKLALEKGQLLESERKKKIKKLLIISQDKILIDSLKELFNEIFQIHSSSEKEETYSAIKTINFHVIVVDLYTEDIDFLNLLMNLNPNNSNTNLVIIGDNKTLEIEKDIVERIGNSLKIELFHRPFETEELKFVMKRILKQA